MSHEDPAVPDELTDIEACMTCLSDDAALLRAAVQKFNEVSERVGFPDRIELAA